MIWQDIVIGICQLAFLPAMLPTIIGKDKPAFVTSVLNTAIVAIITFSLATLELWFAAGTSAMIATIWTILAVQKRQIDIKAKKK